MYIYAEPHAHAHTHAHRRSADWIGGRGETDQFSERDPSVPFWSCDSTLPAVATDFLKVQKADCHLLLSWGEPQPGGPWEEEQDPCG